MGLAPAHALPLSGLHAVYGHHGTSAAYLVGLINSTPVQELAEALAPGNVSQEDIAALGLPQFSADATAELEFRTRELADTVRSIVVDHSVTWTDAPDALRSDIRLGADLTGKWVLEPNPRRFGSLSRVPWARIAPSTNIRGSLEAMEYEDDLLGRHLTLRFTRGTVHIETDELPDLDLRGLLGRLIAGTDVSSLSHLEELLVPIDPVELVAAWRRDLQTITVAADRYRTLRAEIDKIVGAELDQGLASR